MSKCSPLSCRDTALLVVHTPYSMFGTLPQNYVWNRLRFIITAASFFLLECRAPAKFSPLTEQWSVKITLSLKKKKNEKGKKQQQYTYWHAGFHP